MRNPWEDSIIIGLRDAQWFRLNKQNESKDETQRAKTPGLFIKLSSATEKNLGDLIFSASETFYLFEAKAGSDQLSTEWQCSENDKKEGKQPKRAFCSLRDLAAMWIAEPSNPSSQQAIWSSISCHHFLYWSARTFDESDPIGNLHTEPYLLACARRESGISRSSFENFMSTETHPIDGTQEIGTTLPLLSLLDDRGHVVTTSGTGASRKIHHSAPMGLPLFRFKQYLRFLTQFGSGGNESLNAAVCSNEGFLQRVENFADLDSILEPREKLVAERIEREVVDPAAFVREIPRAESNAPFPTRPAPTPKSRHQPGKG